MRKLLLALLWVAVGIQGSGGESQDVDPKALFSAARDGDAEALRRVLCPEDGVTAASSLDTVQIRDEHGWSLLHWAARYGHVEAMETLIDSGADVNVRLLSNGTTPLQWATCEARREAVELLIDRGADVNMRDYNLRWIALHWAACVDANITTILLEAGSDLTAKSRDGQTALHNAALHGNAGAAKELLARGAVMQVKDGQMMTALHNAVMTGQREVAAILLEAGADPNALDEQCAPLHYAAISGDLELLHLLLRNGADPNKLGDLQRTGAASPLHIACKGDFEEAAAALIDAGADVNLPLAGPPYAAAETPLHLAAWRGYNSLVRKLLFANATVNATTVYGLSAIDYAKERGHEDIVTELQEWGGVCAELSQEPPQQPNIGIMFGLPGMGGGGGDGMAGLAERLFGGGEDKEGRFKRANSTTKFADVAGCDEAKEELEDVVAYLKDPERFSKLGGRMNRGILLSGAPGTGKTLLAKAVAGEAGVPYFFASGSEFDEVYAGLGAARVRELFETARKQMPCIVFIDEIDAVGSARQARAERQDSRQTLNQLLAELDGFGTKDGVMLIAATNMPEVLDQALTRPGRIDRRVHVARPDVKGRKEIFQVHLRNVTADSEVDVAILARGTPGFTGADIANMVNMAALSAAKEGKDAVTLRCLESAKDRILMGMERKSALIPEKGRRMTAYHEGGHALVAALVRGARDVHKITIMPRGHALGMVMQLPNDDDLSRSRLEYLASITVCMGGRAAEELIFGEDSVTDGCSSDLEQATDIATVMVERFGMGKRAGFVSYAIDHWRGMVRSEEAKRELHDEVKKIITGAYKEAFSLLKKHVGLLHELADELLRVETMNGEEFVAFLQARGIARAQIEQGASLPMHPSVGELMDPRAGRPGLRRPQGGLLNKFLQLREAGGKLWETCIGASCSIILGEGAGGPPGGRGGMQQRQLDIVEERARSAETRAAKAESMISELAEQIEALKQEMAALAAPTTTTAA